MTQYTLAEPITAAVARELAEYEPLLRQLLFSRGIHTKTDAMAFLSPVYDTQLHDPLLLPQITEAVERIEMALEETEQIAIFSDYDCDGIPGAVVLHDYFTKIGYTNFSNYIPHRHYEGFGLSIEAVEKLAEAGATLIITIDCGSTDVAAVTRANELGVDVIITDHHEPGPVLPAAVAIVNPKISDSYPFPELCGAGVVFKLVQALVLSGAHPITPGWEKWWLDMVGVATIADMVPLIGENRVLATYGLQVLRKSRRPGLIKLLRAAKAQQRFLTEDDIGFTIGPRINAASRMDTPEDAFRLLAASDESTAEQTVQHLERLNNERKGLVAAMSKELHKRIDQLDELPAVLVFGNPEWRPALVGLAANKAAEQYGRPTFLWGRDGNGVIKGSCRSNGTVSVHALMHAVPEYFLEFGGHHQSGGFSVREDMIHSLPDALHTVAIGQSSELVVSQTQRIDADLTLAEVPTTARIAIRALQPFGVGNEKPLFRFRSVAPDSVDVFGKTKEHTKLVFSTDAGQLEAIAFFALPDSFSVVPKVGDELTLIAHLEESYFMGRQQLRLRIVDVLPEN